MKKLITSWMMIVIGFILVSCQQGSYGDIITTDFVLYDFTRAIVGDQMTVSLLTPIGTDYHNFEPTSNDLIAIKQAKAFFFLGYEQNTWLTDNEVLSTYLSSETKYLNLSAVVEKDEHHNEEDDHVHGSHYWTDPIVAISMIEHMLEVIILLDPDNDDIYTYNANSYIEEIERIDTLFKNELINYENKVFYFVGHHALQAFEEHYGLTIIPMEDSIAPGADPTGPQVIEFIETLKNASIDYLFHQEVVSTYTAEVIATHADVANLRELTGYHQISKADFEVGRTYVELFENNVTNLMEALENE